MRDTWEMEKIQKQFVVVDDQHTGNIAYWTPVSVLIYIELNRSSDKKFQKWKPVLNSEAGSHLSFS